MIYAWCLVLTRCGSFFALGHPSVQVGFILISSSRNSDRPLAGLATVPGHRVPWPQELVQR